MVFKNLELDQYSALAIKFSITEDENILLAKVFGFYGIGSEGNGDGLFLFSQLVAHYFVFEPISLILDLQELEYSWGNTILKSLNFFSEIGRDEDEKKQKVITIVSDKNSKPISEVLKMVNEDCYLLSNNLTQAINFAEKEVIKYLQE
jgi:hypothetical protein